MMAATGIPRSSRRRPWRLVGRRMIQGRDCYVWRLELAEPDAEGHHSYGYAHPVETFWPSNEGLGWRALPLCCG